MTQKIRSWRTLKANKLRIQRGNEHVTFLQNVTNIYILQLLKCKCITADLFFFLIWKSLIKKILTRRHQHLEMHIFCDVRHQYDTNILYYFYSSKPSPIIKLDCWVSQRLLGNFEDKTFLALPTLKWIILFGYTRIYSDSWMWANDRLDLHLPGVVRFQITEGLWSLLRQKINDSSNTCCWC